MLYPDFKELLKYESPAKLLGRHFSNKTTSHMAGNFLSSFRGQGMEFDEVRQYAYGDDVRNIDWRVSARTDDVHIKLFKEERQRTVMLAVDCNDYMNFGTRKTFKNIVAAQIASILSFAANKNSDKTGFYLFGNRKNKYEFFKPLNSKKSILSGLKSLCKDHQTSNSYSVDGAIFNLRRLNLNPNILFIISDFREITDEFEKSLYLLSRRSEIVLIKVNDDSDFYLPDVGSLKLKFRDFTYLLNTSNRKAIKKYEEEYKNNLEKITTISKKIRAKLIEINTKDDIVKKLSIGLAKR
jgi:uncharacterized protein (DUF58 family)